MDSILGVLIAVAFIPWVLAVLHVTGLFQLFPPAACPGPEIRDFHLFVLDNIAKGAFIDLVQSFHISLAHCSPSDSYVASGVSFMLRLYTSAIMVAAAVKAWRIWRVRSRTSEEPTQARVMK
jgi:hypothetical protein